MKENLNMGGKYSTADSGKFSTAIDSADSSRNPIMDSPVNLI